MKSLTVAINAQLIPGGGAGGIEQFIIGLVHALGRLDDGNEEYLIIGQWDAPDWLESHLGPNQHIVRGPRPQLGRMEPLKRLIGPLRSPAGRLRRRVREVVFGAAKPSLPTIPESDGFYESLGADVVHFPYQSFVRCSVPMIYNPHDLQHLHYPQFFTQEQFAWRETIYPVGCREAQAVAAESQWAKDDIVRQYAIDLQKVYTILRGSPTELYGPISENILADVRQKFQLPQGFAFYPAQTWPQKNHIRLLEAIKLLRDRHSMTINVVCTGRKNDFWPTIRKRICELKLDRQARFLGFVSPTELRALYRLAECVVFPSLFEGGGFPILEAFWEGTPVACSAVTSLPEYGGDAVLLFDPSSVESIAESMYRMITDGKMRAILSRRGSERIKLFEWKRTANAYRALYRTVAGYPLSDEENSLLVDVGTHSKSPL